MNYLLLILKYLGFTLLGILGLLLLALFLPLTASLHYEDGVLLVKVRVLFFWITLFPKRNRRRKRAGKGKEENADAAETLKKGGLNLQNIFDLLPPAKSLLGRVLGGIWIRGVFLRLIAGGGDAAETGIAAGRIWAVIGIGIAALNNIFHITYKDIVVLPDFMGQYRGTEKFVCIITTIPVILLVVAIGFLIRFLAVSMKNNLKRQSGETGDNENGTLQKG